MLELHQLGGAFQEPFRRNWTTIGGTWTQGGASQPFTLKLVKVAAVLELRRPQNPEGAVKVPGVVLIGGSGSDGRDELVAGHRPFLVWADYLRRKGSAVLHYDKLGVRRLGGNYPAGVTSDFASDAEAAFSYMRARPVMLAGSGVPGDQLLVEQARLIVETNALSRKQADTPLIIDVFS